MTKTQVMELPETLKKADVHKVMKSIFHEIDQGIWREVKQARTPTDRLALMSEADVVKRAWTRLSAYFGPGADNGKG